MARKVAKCPECGEEVQLRGLLGHMRFKHDLTAEEAKERIAGTEATDQVDAAESKGREMIELLQEISAKLDQATGCAAPPKGSPRARRLDVETVVVRGLERLDILEKRLALVTENAELLRSDLAADIRDKLEEETADLRNKLVALQAAWVAATERGESSESVVPAFLSELFDWDDDDARDGDSESVLSSKDGKGAGSEVWDDNFFD